MTVRAPVVAAILALLLTPRIDVAAQQLVTLKITVTITDADHHARPVPRHALLVSDNPSSAQPRRVVTAIDGTAELHVRPGNYTVESDQPLVFQGKSYQWTQTLDVPAGRDTFLALTAENAQIETPGTETRPTGETAAGAPDANPSALLMDWQSSVVALWGPTTTGTGFVVDARGLIVTTARLAGVARTVEVQLAPTDKFEARVLAADAAKDIAVVWADPKVVAAARPVKLGYGDGAPAAKAGVFAISASVHDQKTITSGVVTSTDAHTIVSTVEVDANSLGAPLLNAAGAVVGITKAGDDASSATQRAARIEDARDLIAEALKKMPARTAPRGARLPIEPQTPLAEEALKAAAAGRAGSLGAYQVEAADFDVSIITPVLVYGVRHQESGRRGGGNTGQLPPALQAVQDFGNWEDYVSDDPPVILIRATPKLVEGRWTTVARGAARTQGAAIPPIKRVKTAFSALRVVCGAAEVTPIHPFLIERHLDETHFVYEGLYVFDPASIGPQCGTVTLTLVSEKDPEKPDTRVVDPRVLEQIQQDFRAIR